MVSCTAARWPAVPRPRRRCTRLVRYSFSDMAATRPPAASPPDRRAPASACRSSHCRVGAVRRRGAARERLRGARPAALRPRRDGRHRARISARRQPAGGAFAIQATQAAGDPPLTLAIAGPLHRDHDRRGAARGLRLRRAGRAASRVDDGVRRARRRPALAVAWQNVHRRASDQRQGALLLAAGIAAACAGDRGRRRRRHGAPARQQPAARSS